jgi:hypothetical protein
MKKFLFLSCSTFFAIILIAICLVSFIEISDHSAAKVEEKNSIKIFAYSRPISQYDILGMVKIKGMVSSEKAPHMVELLLEKCKKDFPSAEGIIINSEFEKAEAIKFKN